MNQYCSEIPLKSFFDSIGPTADEIENLDRIAFEGLDDGFSDLDENKGLPDGVKARGHGWLDAGARKDAPVEHVGTEPGSKPLRIARRARDHNGLVDGVVDVDAEPDRIGAWLHIDAEADIPHAAPVVPENREGITRRFSKIRSKALRRMGILFSPAETNSPEGLMRTPRQAAIDRLAVPAIQDGEGLH